MDDNTYIGLIQRERDEEAFTVLYRRYFSYVKSIVGSMSGMSVVASESATDAVRVMGGSCAEGTSCL
jgi:hypothetical protein